MGLLLLVPTDQEPQGLRLGPAWSLNPSFLPHQGPWRQTSQPPCPHCPLARELSLWTPEDMKSGWGLLPLPGPSQTEGSQGAAAMAVSREAGGLQARPRSAAETESIQVPSSLETLTQHPVRVASGGRWAPDLGGLFSEHHWLAGPRLSATHPGH